MGKDQLQLVTGQCQDGQSTMTAVSVSDASVSPQESSTKSSLPQMLDLSRFTGDEEKMRFTAMFSLSCEHSVRSPGNLGTLSFQQPVKTQGSWTSSGLCLEAESFITMESSGQACQNRCTEFAPFTSSQVCMEGTSRKHPGWRL